MFKKFFTFFLAICLIGALGSSYSNDRSSVKIVHNGDVLRGDTGPLVYGPPPPPSINNGYVIPPVVFSAGDNVITIINVHADAKSQYDLQSNGVIRYIAQNPSNALEMHACFMQSSDPNPWNQRNVGYYYTNDGGVSWESGGLVSTTRAGFPVLTITGDSRAVIASHNADGGGIVRTQIYVDVAPGAATWTRVDPGAPDPALGPIWPSMMLNSSNKGPMVSSKNGQDSAFRNILTVTGSNGTLSGYVFIPDCETAEGYSAAAGTTRMGIAFNTLQGGAKLIESTNQGVTWGAPVTIWNWNPADSTGTLRSIDLTYKGDVPCVALGLGWVEPVAGQFAPGLPSKQVFWSPGINGGNPVLVDSAAGLNGSNTTNDVFFSCCRGTIGTFNGGNGLCMTYNKARTDTSSIGNNYFDVWYSYSMNNGASWSTPVRVTNSSGPLVDCRYVAISPTNAGNTVNLIFQRDTIAASNVNGAPPSTSYMMYAKITDVIGIHNISNEVPANYVLGQNYPNPFNPTTKIRFAIPKSGVVTLKLYDAVGKEIGTLVSKQLTAGTFEYELNASNLPSGVYFYRLAADNFVETKKMVLVK